MEGFDKFDRGQMIMACGTGTTLTALFIKEKLAAQRSTWQRGSSESANGRLRQYFPKGIDLSVHSRAHLAKVQKELNQRPRAVLYDRTPIEIFTRLLTSTTVPMLQ